LCRLEVKGLEAEVFGLVRSSIEQGKYWGPVCLVDIGWQSTTVSIIDKMSLRASHSFDFSSSGLNKILSETLQISQEQADDLKVRYGLDPKKPEVVNILIKEIEGLACEVEKICNDFFQREQREIKDVVLAGGSANLFGLKEYLFSRLKKNIEFTRPFAKLAYPLILQKRLEDIGSSFAVACGVAMMALEN